MSKKSAFTLAEVLVTLVIIGVIAAMTIPSLINSIEGKQYQSAALKFASTFSQAMTKSRLENAINPDDMYDQPGPGTDDEWLYDNFYAKCFSLTGNGFMDLSFKESDAGDDSETVYNEAVALSDGSIMYFMPHMLNVWVDVNGKKGPNELTFYKDKPRDVYVLVQTSWQRRALNGGSDDGLVWNNSMMDSYSIYYECDNGGCGG